MATLYIPNTKEFDQQVWQTENNFTQEQYNEWLKTATEALQYIYDKNENVEDTASLYILGDVINLLNNIRIESDHRAESWTCTADDFDKYDTSDLTEEEMNDMIDEVAHDMQNDGVADYYWLAIQHVAEEHGLKEKKQQEEYKHSDLVEFIKTNCHLKQWQIAQAWDYIGSHTPIPHEVSDKIDTAITEFCIEQDISTDLVLSWEDAEDLFIECFTN